MESNLVIFAITALGVTFLATLPAIVASFHQRARARNVQQPTADKKYQDEDGEATPESVAAFSTKWQRLAVLFFAAAGLGCQTALAVLLKASPLGEGKFALQNWAITASWVCSTYLRYSPYSGIQGGVELTDCNVRLSSQFKPSPLLQIVIPYALTTRAYVYRDAVSWSEVCCSQNSMRRQHGAKRRDAFV